MRGRSRRGQGSVELALVMVPLLLLVFGIVDLSRVFGAKSSLEHGIREAAVYGTTHAGDGPGIRGQVEAQASAGGFAVTDGQVAVTYWDPSLRYELGSYPAGAAGYQAASPCPGQVPAEACAYPVAGDYVQVTVAYPWSAATWMIRDLLPPSFQLRLMASSRVQE